MANRQDKKGRSKYPSQYLTISYFMAQSAAFRELSGAALKVLIEIRTRFNGANNGKIFLSLDKLSHALRIGKSTAQRALETLEEHGFIVKTKEGRWIKGQAAEYRLTWESDKNSLRTDEWQRWISKPRKEKARRPWGDRKRKMPHPVKKDSSVPE